MHLQGMAGLGGFGKQQAGLGVQKQNNSSSVIEMLRKQKEDIAQKKQDMIANAAENGTGRQSIQDMLDALDEQIRAIDGQITAASTKQQEEALGVDSKDKKKKEPQTEEEAQLQKMQNMFSLSGHADKAKIMQSVEGKMEGQERVLKSEIAADETISGRPAVRKREELASLQTERAELQGDIGRSLNEIKELISRNNIEKISVSENGLEPKDAETELKTEWTNKISYYQSEQQRINKGEEKEPGFSSVG